MTLHYIIENGQVFGHTIETSGDIVPSNAFSPTPEQQEDITRWLSNNQGVYWNAEMGPHLDPSRDEPQRPEIPPPVLPTPETPPQTTPHASEGAVISLFDSLVSLLDPTATKSQKTARYADLVAKVNAFKTTLED